MKAATVTALFVASSTICMGTPTGSSRISHISRGALHGTIRDALYANSTAKAAPQSSVALRRHPAALSYSDPIKAEECGGAGSDEFWIKADECYPSTSGGALVFECVRLRTAFPLARFVSLTVWLQQSDGTPTLKTFNNDDCTGTPADTSTGVSIMRYSLCVRS